MKELDALFKDELYEVTLDISNRYLAKALKKINEMLEIYPNRPELYYELAQLSYNNWNNGDAEKYYQKSLEVDSAYFPSYTQYALILIKEARYEEAYTLLEKAQTLRNKEDADIHFYFGLLFQHKGDIERAIEHYTNSLYFSINENQINLALNFIKACKEIRGWE
jgi:tetratricopeptide (TPR) repeat protein